MTYRKEREELLRRLAQLDQDEQTARAHRVTSGVTDEEAELAEALHDRLCHSSHTDGCYWFYERSIVTPDWNGNTHKNYLRRARLTLTYVTAAEALLVLDTTNGREPAEDLVNRMREEKNPKRRGWTHPSERDFDGTPPGGIYAPGTK